MILDLVVNKTDDGYTADVPNIHGCESWAHQEDEVIAKAIELVMYYLNVNDEKKIKIDKARGSRNRWVYKLVIDKEV
jgi:predicted RNase H-like HicB family nuclease